ncbi:hypothetical protein HYR99_19965 [Candidatus Poribacteria bacterium]|nr:hypothetical protein [Candidatus Poribacteria bacterium]
MSRNEKFNWGDKLRGAYLSKGGAAYWDGQNEIGEFVASGVYFYRFRAGKFVSIKKMVIIE